VIIHATGTAQSERVVARAPAPRPLSLSPKVSPIPQQVKIVSPQQATVGSTRQELSIGTLKQLRFHFPDTSEQKRIAVVLADVDGQIAALERLFAKKRAVKQGVMQQLLTGRTRLSGVHRALAEPPPVRIVELPTARSVPSESTS